MFFKNDRGITLIEVTIVLCVIITIFMLLSPSLLNYIDEAKRIKTKTETEIVGVITSRLLYDLGPSCLKKDNRSACLGLNRVNIIYSNGPDVEPTEVLTEDFEYYEFNWEIARSRCGFRRGFQDRRSAYFVSCVNRYRSEVCIRKRINWHNDDLSHGDSMLSQFNDNYPKYFTPQERPYVPGFASGQGWRGAYTSPPVGTDPWGKKYLVNTLFTAQHVDIDRCGICSGQLTHEAYRGWWGDYWDKFRNGRYYRNYYDNTRCGINWSYDLFVISAGPNGLFETPFGLDGASAVGDDIVYVIGGNPE